jgi:putative membrane protein
VSDPVPTCHDVAMRSFVIKVLVNGVALWAAAYFVQGIRLGTERSFTTSQLVTVLWVAVIFGLVNTVIKPVLTFFSLPVIILTLGLFTLIVNAAMLELTSWFAGQADLAFHVNDFFWDAVLGSVIITIVSMILNLVIPDGERS